MVFEHCRIYDNIEDCNICMNVMKFLLQYFCPLQQAIFVVVLVNIEILDCQSHTVVIPSLYLYI